MHQALFATARLKAIGAYLAIIGGLTMVVAVLGGLCAITGGRAALSLVASVGDEAEPNLVQLRERDRVMEAMHVPRGNTHVRLVRALSAPQQDAFALAAALDLVERAEQSAQPQPFCDALCVEAKVVSARKSAAKKVSRNKQAARKVRTTRRPLLNAAAIFHRNFAALAPSYD